MFTEKEREALYDIATEFRDRKRLLVPCVSLAQLTHPQLEPHPIPTTQERIEQIQRLHMMGLSTILTIRPFLPYVAASEYAQLVSEAEGQCSVVLGGDWYTDEDGTIDLLTRQSLGSHKSLLDPKAQQISPLDSALDDEPWMINSHPRAITAVASEAQRWNLPFFMRSGPAIDYLRSHDIS